MLPPPQPVLKMTAATINAAGMKNTWRGDEEAKHIKPSVWHFEGRDHIPDAPAA